MGHSTLEDKKFLRLQDRDYLILRFVHEQKFGMKDHLGKLLWPEKPESSAVYRRLAELRKFRLVQSLRNPIGGQPVWQLDVEGHRYLREERSRRAAKGIDDYNSDLPLLANGLDLKNFNHDAVVSEVRVFAERRAGVWISERSLMRQNAQDRDKRKWKHIPDAWFCTKSKFEIALEVELTPKRARRYDKIFDEYNFPVTLVWFICQTEKLAELIRERSRKAYNHSVYTTLLADFRENGADCVLCHRTEKPLRYRDLEEKEETA